MCVFICNCIKKGEDRGYKNAQRSYPWTDDGHGWVLGDPPSVIVTDGMGGPNPPSVMRTAWYRWPVHPIRQQ
jgi:hypothetical protein